MGNVALNKTATASSNVLPFAPAKAVDGDVTPLKRWVCNIIPGWLMVDLGRPTWINRWVVKPMSMSGFSPDYCIQNYKLQGSTDNVVWFDIDTVTNNSLSSTDRTFSPAVCYRYLRVYVDYGLRSNKNIAGIEELEIYEAPNPYLRSLTLSSGSLIPVFSSPVFNYTASVGFDITSITVTPTAEDPSATIKVNNVATISGQASAPINLNVGSNTVNIEVTAVSGLKQTYTVAVTKASSPYLAEITLSSGALAGNFVSTTLNYNANIGYDSTSITVTPTADDSRAGITVNGVAVDSGNPSGSLTMNLIGGNPVITIVVTSKDGTDSRAYTITPTRASDPYLLAMSIVGKGAPIAPTFNRATYAYTASVANNRTPVQIQATAEDLGNITVNGQSVQSGQPSQAINLQVGTNLVTVICNSAVGSDFKKYEITITRAAQ